MHIRLLILSGLLLSGCSLDARQPNILFICVDDLRPELASFGAEYVHSPHMDRLASEGRPFNRHYVQAPTCGASRYALLTGQYGPSRNDALFQRAKRLEQENVDLSPSLPAYFRQQGYTTVAIGKVSHHPGGKGGGDWSDPNVPELPDGWDRSTMPSGAWKTPKGAMHGLANGEVRKNAGDMDVYQAFDGDDMSYPDGLIRKEAVRQLAAFVEEDKDKPFFLAVGFIRPHLPLGAPKKYLDHYADKELPPIPHPEKPGHKTTWHSSREFMKYNRWEKDPNEDAEFADKVRRHYAAAVSYVDAQIGYVLAELERTGLDQNTIVVLWGDHGWHLGEHAVWGKHSLFEESLRAPLVIRPPQPLDAPGTMSEAIVETIDLYPTLCELAGLDIPPGMDGESLVPHLNDPTLRGGWAISYHGRANGTIVKDGFRLIAHGKKDYVELYDHASKENETRNVADEHPDKVQELMSILKREYPEALK